MADLCRKSRSSRSCREVHGTVNTDTKEMISKLI